MNLIKLRLLFCADPDDTFHGTHRHHFSETPVFAGGGVMAVGTKELPVVAGGGEE